MPRVKFKQRAKPFDPSNSIVWTKGKGTPIAGYSQIVAQTAIKTAQHLETKWVTQEEADPAGDERRGLERMLTQTGYAGLSFASAKSAIDAQVR